MRSNCVILLPTAPNILFIWWYLPSVISIVPSVNEIIFILQGAVLYPSLNAILAVISFPTKSPALFPNDLKKLIEFNDDANIEKERLIEIINEDGLLSMEELKNLRLMSVDELQELVATITEGEIVENEEED